VAARSKTWSYDLSIAGIAGSSPTRGHGCEVDVPATDRSLIHRSPTECGVSECGRRTSYKRFRPTRAVEP